MLSGNTQPGTRYLERVSAPMLKTKDLLLAAGAASRGVGNPPTFRNLPRSKVEAFSGVR